MTDPGAATGSTHPVRFPRIARLGAALLLAIAVAVLSHVVLCRAMIVTDENSYVFQAYNFLEGCLRRPFPPLHRQVTSEMIICDEAVGWFSRYPPGHAAWLVPGAALDNVRVMSSVAAALAVLLLCALARRLQVAEPFLCWMALCSPFVFFMFGTLMSHTSGFLAAGGLLYFYIRWRQTGRLADAVLAGLCWAWFFLNRTYTALLVAVPFGVDTLWHLFPRRRERAAWVGACAFAGSAAIGIVAYLAYNAAALGDAFHPTYLYYDAGERLGFGPRSTHGKPVHHDLARGWANLKRNVLLLDQWAFGFRGSLVALLALAAVGWRRRWTPLLLAAPVAVWLGYVYFWFEGVDTVGAVYFFETLPYLFLAAGLGLERLRRALAPQPAWRRGAFWAVALVLATLFPVRFAWDTGRALRAERVYEGQLLDLIEGLPPQSLVIVQNVPEEPYMKEIVFNRKGVATDPLRARGLGSRNRVIAACFPDRKPYLLDGKAMTVEPFADDTPLRMHLSGGRPSCTVGRNGNDPAGGGGRVRLADAARDDAGFLAFGSYYTVLPARYRVTFEAEVRDAAADAPVVFELSADRGQCLLAERAVATSTDGPVVLEVDVAGFPELEPRVRYGGTGSVVLRGIVIEEVR